MMFLLKGRLVSLPSHEHFLTNATPPDQPKGRELFTLVAWCSPSATVFFRLTPLLRPLGERTATSALNSANGGLH